MWLSVSRELIKDAERDLKDVGIHCIDDQCLHDGTVFLGDTTSSTKYAKGLGRKDKGILFLTYNLLVSNNRLEQIIAWCAGTEHSAPNRSSSSGSSSSSSKPITNTANNNRQFEQAFDGCIIFDEAHKAKNLANNTKTANLVLELQRRLPLARIVYCSATGVSDVDQLGYAERYVKEL